MTSDEMLPVEKLNRYYFEKSGLDKQHIFTAPELTEYLNWMAKEYKKESHILNPAVGFDRASDRSSKSIMAQMIQSERHRDDATFLSDLYSNHSESNFIIPHSDIYASRTLRYMPSCWHANEFFCIYYVFAGSCTLYFQDETIRLRPGTAIIIAPSALHACPRNDDSVVLYTYFIRSSTFDRVFWNNLPPENLLSSFFYQALNEGASTAYLHFETDCDKDIEYLLRTIYDEAFEQKPYCTQLLNSLMSTFFVVLLRRFEGTAHLPRTDDLHWNHKFSAILSYIQNNYSTATLSELSQKFHYSERQIGRIVESCTGLGFSQLILKLRMKQALTLLRQKNVSVETVAGQVGYSAVSSFYRAFVKYYGSAPTVYLAEKETE